MAQTLAAPRMNGATWTFLAAAGACAVADWIVVAPGSGRKGLEYLLKPATMVALIAAALALDPEDGGQRAWFVVALVLSLAGDVFLMLPSDLFVPGLASFLLAHVSYIVGFAITGYDPVTASFGVGIVALAAAILGIRILREVRSRNAPLLGPVVVYMTVISAMVVLAFGAEEPLAIAGALFFYCSDSLIAWDRFVAPKTWARPAIMSTYHVAQALLVLSLVR